MPRLQAVPAKKVDLSLIVADFERTTREREEVYSERERLPRNSFLFDVQRLEGLTFISDLFTLEMPIYIYIIYIYTRLHYRRCSRLVEGTDNVLGTRCRNRQTICLFWNVYENVSLWSHGVNPPPVCAQERHLRWSIGDLYGSRAISEYKMHTGHL